MNLILIYEDCDILVLNKPAGIVVHPDSHYQTETVVNALQQLGIPLAQSDMPDRPGIVHRLDKDTEGLLLIAKSEVAFHSLKEQFKARQVHKAYRAVVKGIVRNDYFEVDLPIGRSVSERKKMQAFHPSALKGRAAHTEVTVLKRGTNTTLIEAVISTGRTHQIRVHLAAKGHPVLGDPVYFKRNKKNTGQLLQAYKLSFSHPQSGMRMTFELPISKRVVLT